jgi:hypothetical protein
VSIPKATSIGATAFANTGMGLLTLTLGSTVPTLGQNMFSQVTAAKAVTVKVPSGAAAWSGIIGSYTTDTTTGNWGNAFRGKGWDGTSYLSGVVNENIKLTIEYMP